MVRASIPSHTKSGPPRFAYIRSRPPRRTRYRLFHQRLPPSFQGLPLDCLTGPRVPRPSCSTARLRGSNMVPRIQIHTNLPARAFGDPPRRSGLYRDASIACAMGMPGGRGCASRGIRGPYSTCRVTSQFVLEQGTSSSSTQTRRSSSSTGTESGGGVPLRAFSFTGLDLAGVNQAAYCLLGDLWNCACVRRGTAAMLIRFKGRSLILVVKFLT